MAFCKVCSEDISSDRRARIKLKGNAAGVDVVYSELFDSLLEKYADHPFSTLHNYLSEEPAFVCKACFTVFKKYCDVKTSVQNLKHKLNASYGQASTDVSLYKGICQ